MNSRNSHKPPVPVFIATTIVIFFLSLSAADSIGMVPNYLDDSAPSEAALALNNLPMLGENPVPISVAPATTLPTRIQIPAIDLDLAIQNPNTRNIEALDALLKNGPARYVDSARLGESGNMIVFAHSSNLPVVHNLMYKAFNRVPELKAGDSITLIGENNVSYLYVVRGVEKADATDTTIDLSAKNGTRLTLVTCDTLTGKSARFVLTADFVGTIGE
jgi:LPXTG-site transpeptidase (sortase) family protein